MAKAIVWPIWKPVHLKSGHFCPNFKWFLTKSQPFVQISNGWASGFQIPFEIQTICKPTSFWPSEIQTSPDFRSPLELDACCCCNVLSIFAAGRIAIRSRLWRYRWNAQIQGRFPIPSTRWTRRRRIRPRRLLNNDVFEKKNYRNIFVESSCARKKQKRFFNCVWEQTNSFPNTF